MQTLTVEEYRGIAELADTRLNSLSKYWAKHPNESRRYDKYATALFQAQLKLCREILNVNLPSDLYNWPFRFSARIEYFRSLTSLYDSPFKLGVYFEFLRHILQNIQPTCSRALNSFQLAEIDFVINEAKQFGNKKGAKKIISIAEAERKILNEDCKSSYYLNYRFHYLREDIATILDQDLYSGAIRYALWEKLCSGNSDYTRHDQVWIDRMSVDLGRSRCQSWSQENWCRNSLLFLDELLSDIFFAANTIADGPNELPYKFRRGIGLLVRCDEAEFLAHGAEAALRDLSELARDESAPEWVFNCLSDADELYSNTRVLTLPMTTQKQYFALFETPEE